MAPKPRPLQPGEAMIDNQFGSSDSGQNTTGGGNPVPAGGYSLDQQQSPQNGQQRPRQPSPNKEQPIIAKRPWFVRKEPQQDPSGRVVSGKSPSNLAESKAAGDPPDDARQSSMLMREGDLLDRTFDNVENITCHRTSTSKAPPPPIFACTPMGNDEAADIAALSEAKQASYNIELYDEEEEDYENELQHDETNNVPSPATAASSRPPLVPVNSMLAEEQQQHVDAVPTESATTENAVQAERSGHNRGMMDFLFENVTNMMCREERSLAIGPSDTQQVELSQAQPSQQVRAAPAAIQVDDEENGGVATQNEDKDDSPINLHQIVSDNPNDVDGYADACDSIFATAKSPVASDTSSCKGIPPLQDPFAPIHYTDSAHSARGSRPRTGMMLLADGSIVVPEETSNRWARQARKSALYSQGGTPYSQSSAISVIRENSLLDVASGSTDHWYSNPTVPRSSLRDKNRSMSKRVSHGGSETFFVPRDSDEEDGRGKNVWTEQDMERRSFWKQVAFATTITLISCGLLVFALSFFWPADKLR